MPKVKGFYNKYIIKGDVTTIFLEKKTGEMFKTLIDTEDLEKLIKLNLPWNAMYTKNNDSNYAKASLYYRDKNNKRKAKILLLHRIVTNAKEGSVVDHINFNTLDNRKSNLKITVTDKNTKKRNSKNKNNTSGYRNVSWIESDQKYIVQLQVNGKNTRLGTFTDVDEAGKFAEDMRKEIYGEYAGLN